MAQHHLHQPPKKADVEIVHNTDKDNQHKKDFDKATSFNEISAHLLEQVEENLPSHEAHANKLKELEGLMQGVIKNHADLKTELEHIQNKKQKKAADHVDLQKAFSTTQESLKKHEAATLANTTALVENITKIRDLVTGLTTRVEKLEAPETPRITNVVENEQKRNSELEKNLKLLTDKFNNLVQNNTAREKEKNEQQETADAKLAQDQAAKDATLKNILKEFTTLSSTVTTQNQTINDMTLSNSSLWQRVQLCMTANAVILCTAIWFWWQAHKA